MNKFFVSAICGCLAVLSSHGQSGDLSEVLSEITQNNKQLKAYQSYLESRDLSNQTLNNLDNLQVSGALLPVGNNSTSAYMEFEVSQSFEFPSTYRARERYIDQDKIQQEIAWQKDRQEILNKASDICTDLIFQQKRKAVELVRMEQARTVFEQVREMYDNDQVGKLELNKAKIAWLKQQFAIEQIDRDISQTLLNLKSFNGGNDIAFSQADYGDGLVLMSLDSLWSQKLLDDPVLRYLEESEKTALAKISMEKKERLPEFDVGLNYEGVRGENYAGISGGLSIPVWNRRNTIKAAEALYVFEQRQSDAVASALYADFEGNYREYIYLLNKYREYESSLAEIDSEELLALAYELGEFSYTEYYMELKFYQDAKDEMLMMERQLHLLKNKLLKHNL